MSKRRILTGASTMALAILVGAAGLAQELPPSSANPNAGPPPPPAYTINAPTLPSTKLSSIKLNAAQIEPPANPSPILNVTPPEQKRLEDKRWTTGVVTHQLSLVDEVPPETVLSEAYMRTRDDNAAELTLKDTVFLALRNNPGVQADRLNPLASYETIRQANAVFDPDMVSTLGVLKSVSPTTSVLQTGGASAFSVKQYLWNFGINKQLASTNGTLSLAFNNNRALSNSVFSSVNPSYNPGLTISLLQPLLRNFGNQFATINVRIAEENQKEAQFSYEQNLNDFVQRVGSDYWNVVRAEENLQVAREALKLAEDLVRQNEISVKVGVLAPLDIKEAQSEAATRAADVFAADNQLAVARVTLRQDVMLNPNGTFVPQQIEPSDKPTETQKVMADEEKSLELAMEYRPELAAMREEIRSLLLQVKFAENQTLPQFNVGAQIGLTATAGNAKCTTNFTGALGNCVPSGSAIRNGTQLPFEGIYGDALDKMWGFSFYNYAVVLNVEQPMMNDASKAALAQAKVQYEQTRMLYRDLISSVVVDVESSLSSVNTGIKRVQATTVATEYSKESLRAEQERYRVGMANTHELLQFQDELVSALGNQVQAQVDLEIAKLQLGHSQGTLLRSFQVNFVTEDPGRDTPWYARF